MDLRDLERARIDGGLTPFDFARPGLGQRLRFAALIAFLGGLLLGWSLLASLWSPFLARPAGARIGRAAISWMYRTFWRAAEAAGMMEVDAAALDVLADEPGGLIVAANHPTMLDAMIVVGRLPRGVCIMRADLMRNIFLGAGARMARYIGNDTGRALVRDAVASLQEGSQLVLFPEGTRTVQPPVNRFKPGITLIAHLANVSIQTVIIETRSPYLRKGWPLLRPPPGKVMVRARLGKRFAPDADHRALLQRLEAYFAHEADPFQ